MKHFDVPIKATRHSILLFRKSFESLLAIPGSDVRVWRQVVTFLFLTHWLPCVPAVNGRDERWPLFLLWRHDLWPKLASSILKFYWRKDLSNDTQIREIGSVEPEIYTKMVRNSNLTDQLGSKLPANTRRYSMVKLACLDDAFLGWKQAQ